MIIRGFAEFSINSTMPNRNRISRIRVTQFGCAGAKGRQGTRLPTVLCLPSARVPHRWRNMCSGRRSLISFGLLPIPKFFLFSSKYDFKWIGFVFDILFGCACRLRLPELLIREEWVLWRTYAWDRYDDY